MTPSNDLFQLVSRVGTKAVLSGQDAGVVFFVKILNVRTEYGRARYLITPVSGMGERWVDEARLRFPEDKKPETGSE